MKFTEPTPKAVAQMVAWSGIAGNHDGNSWDVSVTAHGALIEITVTPYDEDTGDEVRGWTKKFKLVVQETT